MRTTPAGEGKLEVRKMFEPNRLQEQSLERAYEALAPVVKRLVASEPRAVQRSQPRAARRSSGGTGQ
jgi:hypothetical protein